MKSYSKFLAVMTIVLCTITNKGFSQSDSGLNLIYGGFYESILEIQNARNITLFSDIDFVKKYVHLVLTEVFGEETLAFYTEFLFFDKGDNWFLVFFKQSPNNETIKGITINKHSHYNSIGVIVRKTNGELISLTQF
jgi:hypothetical protein